MVRSLTRGREGAGAPRAVRATAETTTCATALTAPGPTVQVNRFVEPMGAKPDCCEKRSVPAPATAPAMKATSGPPRPRNARSRPPRTPRAPPMMSPSDTQPIGVSNGDPGNLTMPCTVHDSVMTVTRYRPTTFVACRARSTAPLHSVPRASGTGFSSSVSGPAETRTIAPAAGSSDIHATGTRGSASRRIALAAVCAADRLRPLRMTSHSGLAAAKPTRPKPHVARPRSAATNTAPQRRPPRPSMFPSLCPAPP